MKTLFSFLSAALLLLVWQPASKAGDLPQLGIITETGWMLAIQPDGSAHLYRAKEGKILADAPPREFDYGKIVAAIKDTPFNSAKHATRLAFFFGNLDHSAEVPLPEIPLVLQTLEKAEKFFSKTPEIKQLFLQYPLSRQADGEI